MTKHYLTFSWLPTILLLPFVLLSNLNIPSWAQESPANIAASTPKDSQDLPNFHKVHPYLYRGGKPSEAGLKELQKMGVKTLIDLRAPSERQINEPEIAHQLGMTYINLPMSAEAPTQTQVNTVLSLIKQARDNPKSGKVMVHCAHGSDRTGCMIGIWRVKEEGWSYDKAYEEMRKYWFTPKFTKLSETVKQYAK